MDEYGVCKYIETHRQDLFTLVGELVEIPSVSGNESAAQERIAAEFETMGLEPDVWEPDVEALRNHPAYFDTKTYDDVGYEGRPNVAATISGTGDEEGRSLALSGHIDVVDVDADEWTYDPWKATIENGRMYGRGACDMKGGLAATLFVAQTLDACDVDLCGDLILESTIDEEAGGTGGVLSALERGYQPDAAIIAEPYGVPDIGIASAGVRYFRITVPGKSAHAARGFDGVNSVNKATKIIEALDQLDRERKERINFEPAVNQNKRAEGEVTNLNVGIINAGDWPSTVPPETTIECRIGWPPGESQDEIQRQVNAAIQTVVDDDEWLSANPPELEWFGWNAEPHECDRDAEIVQTVTIQAERVCGKSGKYTGGLGGLDERFYVKYYDIPCPSVGPKGGNIHGADEYLDLDSLVDATKTIALATMDYCKVDS